jgi:hypothetical protein
MAINYDELGNVINSDGISGENNYNSSDIERKTKKSDTNLPENYYSTQQAGTNILNSYRSVNYNFTLAAISAYQASRPETYDLKNPKYIVATSKGKNKNDRINASLSENNRLVNKNQLNNTRQLFDDISSFNKDTPGSFDLFIDDVSIDSTFSFKDGAVTLPLKFNFEVIEPYSLNGFIEALQICSLASGYKDYQKASYVLILDFAGIPDSSDVPLPESVPNSSKMFFIQITGIQVSVTDSGTKYKVEAVAVGDKARGNAVSKTKRKIVGEGNTVKQLLSNIVKGLNEQSLLEAKSSSKNQTMSDSYEILFPVYNDNGEIIPGKDNSIATEAFWDDLASANSNPAMNKIGETNSAYQPVGTAIKSTTKKESQSTLSYQHTAQFDSGVPITDIISSTIRDSNYVKKVIKAFQSNGDPKSVLDSNGFLNYFIITPKLMAKDGPDNPETNQPYYTYTYLVEPYKILYNMAVPGAGNQAIDAKKIQKFSLRNYKYFYTGLNVDILDFKINLNHLFFEEVPKDLGNSESDPSADSAKSGNSTNTRFGNSGKDTGSKAAQYSTNNASTENPSGMPNSTAPDGVGWQQSVKIMHEKLANSVGFITGELSILGDPYYLTATGSGNSLNKNSQFGKLANGQEAAARAGMVLISLAFNNPDDIGESGFVKFNNNPLPISGLYQITIVKSHFKDGIFKQNLSILRVPGQTLDQKPDDPSLIFDAYPNPEDQIETSRGPNPPSYAITTNDGTIGVRSNSLNLQSILNKTISNNPGGLGGNNNSVFGAVNPAGNIPNSIYGIIPNGPNQLASGIRASVSGLVATQAKGLGQAALAKGSSLALNAVFPGSGLVLNALTGNLLGNQYNLKNVLGSNSLNAAASNVSNLIGDVGNKVSGLFGASKLFGIKTSLGNLSGQLDTKTLSSLNGLYNVIPPNVNIKTASNQGIRTDSLTQDGLSKLPPIPEQSVGIRTPGFIENNANSNYNVLGNFNNPYQIDTVAQVGKIQSAFDLYSGISEKPLSVEANYSIVNQNLSKSVIAQYGSRSKNEVSPLINALNNNIA